MRKYLIIFIISIIGLFTRFYISGHGIFGDGNAYFSYAHTLYFEHGLKFDGIYHHLSNFPGKKYTFSRVFWGTDPGPFGVRHNPWTIGTGIFWLPAMGLTDILTRSVGWQLGRYSIVYEFGIGVGGILYGLMGLWWLEQYLQKKFDKKIANILIISLYTATNLLYYVSLEPALSHQIVFFLLSGLLLCTSKKITSKYHVFICGLAMGLLVITRMADSLLLLPIMYQLWVNTLSHLKWSTGRQQLIIILVGFFIGSLPQLMNQYVMSGSLWQNPYFNGENGQFTFNISHLWGSLFSVHRGLFSWTPFLLIGIMGLIIQAKQRGEWLYKTVLISLILFWLAVSQWSGVASAGFGARLFVGSLPYFALGTGSILKRLSPQKQIALVIIGTLCNVMILNQFLIDPNRMVKDQGLTYQNFLTGNITSLVTTMEKVTHTVRHR